MTPRLRVAVLAGGRSSEHEISLASARSVVEALDPARYETRTIEIGRDGAWALPPGDVPLRADRVAARICPCRPPRRPAALGAVDVVLPILHGPFGEDGTVQGLLELAGVPYVGSGVTASALCMDKDLFKAVLRDRGIPVAPNITLRPGDPIANPFGYPVFVKPARLGSSVGISKARTAEELEAAVALARRHDDKVLVEEFQPGVEVEVGVLGNREPIASLVGEIVAHADWYDFDAKYADGGMDLIVPRAAAGRDARARAAAGRRLVRRDRLRGHGAGRLLRAARTARSSSTSSTRSRASPRRASTRSCSPRAASRTPALLDRLVELALDRHEQRKQLEF